MKVSAQHKHARISPRKVREFRSVIMGRQVAEAQAQLSWMKGKGAETLLKVLNSAVANAVNNHELEAAKLVVADVVVGDGLKMKRFQPAAKGMAHPFVKRTSHVSIIVEDSYGA